VATAVSKERRRRDIVATEGGIAVREQQDGQEFPAREAGKKNLMGVIVKVRFRRSEGMGSISAIARDLNRLRQIMPKSRKLPRSIFFLCPGRLFLTPDRAFILIFEEAYDLEGFEGDFILFTPKELSPRFLFHPRG